MIMALFGANFPLPDLSGPIPEDMGLYKSHNFRVYQIILKEMGLMCTYVLVCVCASVCACVCVRARARDRQTD